MKAVVYQRYKVMLYVTITQQQVSLEQGPVHVATWWMGASLAPKQKLPWSKLNHGSHASTTDQTGNGENRQKPHVAHRQVPDEENEKKDSKQTFAPIPQTTHYHHHHHHIAASIMATNSAHTAPTEIV